MVKEHYANPQQRRAIKNRQKKVMRYKVYKEYKKTLSRDDVGNGLGSDRHSELPAAASTADEQLGTVSAPRTARNASNKSRLGAVEAARRSFESKQRALQQEREAAQQLAAERRRQQTVARNRRKHESVQMTKRTKRGQPILSHTVHKMLASLEQQK